MTEKNNEGELSKHELKFTDSAAHAPESIVRWAKKLTEAQGCPTKLTHEASGYHLYLPCPDCLWTHGVRELDDPKYAINLSMVAGLGKHGDSGEAAWMPGAMEARMDKEGLKDFGSGICMRTSKARKPHRHSVGELVNMSTVTERHPDIHTSAKILGSAGSAEHESKWEEDPITGKKCPPAPGEIVPLSSLPAGHPAIKYLTNRGYDIAEIEAQFRTSFCVKEYPHGENGIFYRRMPGGWKDTPQHRIIFHSLIDGVPLTWQARVIEKVSDDGLNRYMLHPYVGGYYNSENVSAILKSVREASFQGEVELVKDPKGGYWAYLWSWTHTRANPQAKWQERPPFDAVRNGALQFQPAKYRTAKYSTRQLMGWDAAVKRADDSSEAIKWVVLCEGPLDAARAGPGGIAIIGSSLSPANANKVVQKFNMAFTAFDDDTAGRGATEKISKILMGPNMKSSNLIAAMPLQIPDGKDVGDLTPAEYERIFQGTFKRSKRLQ